MLLKNISIPLQWVGPIRISGLCNEKNREERISVPLATLESPLWPSVQRGAILSQRSSQGIQTTLTDDRMTRSVLLETDSAQQSSSLALWIREHQSEIAHVIESSSRYARFLRTHTEQVGNLLYVRIEINSGEASGHNMVTQASDYFIDWILGKKTGVRYLSISGNFCADKKVSCVNGLLGRGKGVIAELSLSEKLCKHYLRTTPERIVALNIRKNWMGSTLAGGIRTANAHFANMLLAFYLATGQDAANIVEGSQGFVHAEVRKDQKAGGEQSLLYFSVTVPHIIVGTIGSGKDLSFAQHNLEQLGCLKKNRSTHSARKETDSNRLAKIIAATVLCGELSLLAAQTNRGELMQAHTFFERKVR